MRIGIISSPYLPIPPLKYGGTEQVVNALIHGLQEIGEEPVLFAPADSQINCELIPICDTAINFSKTDAEQIKISQKVSEIEKNTHELVKKHAKTIDIFHTHWLDLKPIKNTPHVTTLHGEINFANYQFYKERQDIPFVSISKNQQQTMPSLNFQGVVYNGLISEPFPFESQPKNYLCFLGRMDQDKSPHRAIAFAKLVGMKLIMAGKVDFQGKHYFETMIEPEIDGEMIQFMGEIGFVEKCKLLKNAYCNLHPIEFREPFGLSVIEAAYCGTPTIAMRRGSMQELIEDGRTGILAEDMIEAISRFNEIEGMDRKYISQRARMLFSHKKMALDYLRIYHGVLKKWKK